MANGYISQVQLPNNKTYNIRDKELIPRLKATVGHSSKNLLDVTKYTTPGGTSNIQINEDTGSLSFTGTGLWRSLSYFENDNLGLKPNDTTYILTCINNLANSSPGRLAIRRRDTNGIISSAHLSTTGKKELKFTASSEMFPNGWYISIMATGSTSTTSSIDISNLMLREASIADDTFEPYVTPTDELIARLDQRIYELERINEIIEPDPDKGEYFITVFNNSGSDCDIWLTTPIADGGAFYNKYVYSHWVTEYHGPLDYCGKRIMVLFRAGTGDIVMTLNSSQSGQGRFYEQFAVDRFLDMCDVKDGSSTNYISIHLCDDGGIRSQAEYEAYIGN